MLVEMLTATAGCSFAWARNAAMALYLTVAYGRRSDGGGRVEAWISTT
jgi:hypothetical protein